MASQIDLTSSSPNRYMIAGPGYHQDILDQLPKDFKLVCPDGFVKIHRLLLTGLSPFLENLLLDKNPKKTPCVTLADVKLKHLRKVVILLYHGQIVVDNDEKEKVCEILNMLQFPVDELFSRKATKKDLSLQEAISSRIDMQESGVNGCDENLPNELADSSELGTRERAIEVISLVDMERNGNEAEDPEANPAISVCLPRSREETVSSDVEGEQSGSDRCEEDLITKPTIVDDSSRSGARKRPIQVTSLEDETETNSLEVNPAKSMCRREISQNDSNLGMDSGSASDNLCDDETAGSKSSDDIQAELGFIEEDTRGNQQMNEIEIDGSVVDIGMDVEDQSLPLSDAPNDSGLISDHNQSSVDLLAIFTSQRDDEEAERYAGAEGAFPSQTDLEGLNEVDQFLISAGDFNAAYIKIMQSEAKAPDPAPVGIDVREIRTVVYAENMLKGPNFKLLKKHDGSCAIHGATRLKNQKLVKCLIDNGVCTVNETDLDANTPLHIATQMHSEALIGYLIERGASLYAVNNEGLTPMFMALKNVDDDTLQILRQLEENGLRMEDYARDALIFLFKEYCGTEESNQNDLYEGGVLNVIRYFIGKNGLIQFDHHGSIMSKLVERIDFDEIFQFNASRILTINEFSTPEDFAFRLWTKNITLEKLVLCLLECKQFKVAREFVVEFLCKKATKYSNGYSGVREAFAFDSIIGHVVIIRAQDKDICLNRIIDTMVDVKLCTSHDEIPNDTAQEGLYALPVGDLTADILNKLKEKGGRFIVVADSVAPGLEQECTVVEDRIEWSDLSREARHEFGTPGDFCGFRLGEESLSLFLQCIRELSPRKIRGEDCYTFFQFLQGKKLIDLMKRRTTLTNILGELFDECVSRLTNEEIQILEIIAVKETFGYSPSPVMENLSIMGDLVTKKWLVKEDKDFKFRNKVALSYFLAKRILRLPQKLSLQKTEFLFRSKIKRFKLLRRLSMNARIFTNDSFAYFMDRLLGIGEQSVFDLNFNESFITEFLEACAASNAHNLLQFLSCQTEIKCESRNIIPLLVCGSVLLPEQRIVERKELIQKLIINGNKSHLKRVVLTAGRNVHGSFLSLDMPFIHVELIKTLIESDIYEPHYYGYDPHEITFAQLAPLYMPLDQFEELVHFLLKKGFASKFLSPGRLHFNNPLELAQEYFKQRPSIKTTLISAGVDLEHFPNHDAYRYYRIREDKSLYTPSDYYKI